MIIELTVNYFQNPDSRTLLTVGDSEIGRMSNIVIQKVKAFGVPEFIRWVSSFLSARLCARWYD